MKGNILFLLCAGSTSSSFLFLIDHFARGPCVQLVQLAKKLKKSNVSVDVISFGEEVRAKRVCMHACVRVCCLLVLEQPDCVGFYKPP